MFYLKINSEQRLHWNEDPNDLSVFIVVITTVQHELGISTHILTNRKERKAVSSKHNMLGHSIMNILTQFEVAIDTGVFRLTEDMPVTGVNALRTFLASSSEPFAHSQLQMVLTAADVRPPEENDDLNYPSP